MKKNYVKAYKGYGVPEGATHWQPEKEGWHACFVKYEDNIPMYWNADHGTRWRPLGGLSPFVYELPEVEQEWVPTHELVNNTSDIFKGTPVKLHTTVLNRVGAEVSIVELFGGDVYGVYSRHLTKIKTQEEKEREEFIEQSKKVTFVAQTYSLDPDLLFGVQFDAGARFIGDKENDNN